MLIISIAFLVLSVALLAPCLYLLSLTLASFLYRPDRQARTEPKTRFAILVPAHNEEQVIPEFFRSVARQDYPRELFDVFVVADNCTDSTAQVCRDNGAYAFERQDRVLVGKPHALRWLVEIVLNRDEQHDAFVFVDADSVISPSFLSVMDAKFQSGSEVVQSHYTVSNAGQTSASALRYVGFQLMNYVRPLGKRVLGLSSGLYGTGMAFHRSVMSTHSWDAFTLAEDVEFYLKLVNRGVKIDFAPEITVLSAMPASLKESRSQNLRWEKGRVQMARKYGLPYLIQGLLRANPDRLFAGLDQLIPPLSVIFMLTFLALVASVAIGEMWMIGMGLAMNLALAGHIFMGLLSSRAPLRVYRAFLFAPWAIAWKIVVYAQALKPGHLTWTKTQRP